MRNKFSTDYLVTLADLDEDALYQLYKESISKLKNKDTDNKGRKMHTIRVMMIRSIISDKYSLKASHRTPDFDNPMCNPQVNRFYK